MKWGVVRFPGSLDDGDALYALRDVMGQDAAMLAYLRGHICDTGAAGSCRHAAAT